MNQQEQKLQNMQQSSISYQFLIKLFQLAISFSVFSFIFLHPSWSPLFHSFVSYLSTLLSQITALATDKHYIFLLCNGILVFIAKYSGHTVDTRPSALPDTSVDNDLVMYKTYRQSMQLSTEKSVLVEDGGATNEDEIENRADLNEVVQEEEVEEKHVLYENTYETLKEEEEDYVNSNDNENEYLKEISDNWSFEKNQDDNEVGEQEEEEEEEEQEEEAIAKLSTEELNRKFDDFIRKMKEDLRIEARQQLIVV